MSRLKGSRTVSRKALGNIEYESLKDDSNSNSELSSTDTAIPKSAIDVALELLDQEEREAIVVARTAALNKSRPRGRPSLRKSVEKTTNLCINNCVPEHSKSELQQDGGKNQGEFSHDCSAVLPRRGVSSLRTYSAYPILKDHLEVEATARVVPPSLEASLFGTDSGDPESAHFHEMVFLNYGSADGRLEDNGDQNFVTDGHNKKGILPARKGLNIKDGTLGEKGECSGHFNHQDFLPLASHRGLNSPICVDSIEVAKIGTLVSVNSGTSSMDVRPSAYRSNLIDAKKSRGRPKKNPFPDVKSPPHKRPRGRPRKNGTDPVQKRNRKPAEKKPLVHMLRRKARRAATMVHDFIEFYSKINLDDLEAFHAQAISFVRMLVDEYADQAKNDSAKCSHEGVGTAKVDCNIEQNSDSDMESEPMNHYVPSKRANCDTATLSEPHVTFRMERDEPNDLGENNAEFDYHSNSGHYRKFGKGLNEAVHKVNLGQRRELASKIIDAIPVIRGTVLQPLPTVNDSL